MGKTAVAVDLSDSERRELGSLASRRRTAQGMAQRARIVLLAAEGVENKDICARVGASPSPRSKSAAARIARLKSWKPQSGPISTPSTPTQNPSAGPNPPTTFSLASSGSAPLPSAPLKPDQIVTTSESGH